MMLTVTPFSDDDARELAVQRSQREGGDERARIAALAAGGRAFSLRERPGGRLVAIAGLAEQASHYATGWAVLAEGKSGGAMLALTRIVQRYLRKREFPVVDALVHADHPAARRWAMRLGFVAEARLSQRAPDGGDMIVYLYQGAE